MKTEDQYDVMFLKHGGVAECRWDLPWPRKVCSGDSEEIQNVGLEGNIQPMDSKLKILSDASYDLVEATMYHEMIGSLIFLTNTRP